MNKKLLVPIFMTLLFVFSAFGYTITMRSPATNGYITTGSLLNVSFDSGENLTALAIFAYSSSTRNSSSSSLVINISNNTATDFNTGDANATFRSSFVFDDSNDYTFTCTAYNNSGATQACSVSSTGVDIDTQVTTAPSSITFSNPVQSGNTITATVSLANAHLCYIGFGGNPRQSMTRSGTTCTYTVQRDSPPNGDYQVILTASDGTNESTSATQYITIRSALSDGGGLWGGTLVEEKSNGAQSVLGSSSNPFQKNDNRGLLIVVAIVLGLILFKGKRR